MIKKKRSIQMVALSWTMALVVLLACSSERPRVSAGRRVKLIEVTTIGSDDGPDFIGYLVTLTRLQDGRYVLYDLYRPGVLRIFDQSGAFFGEFGRSGEGPGEFSDPVFHHLDETGDRLLILDRGNSRLSIWSSDGSSLIATKRLEVSQPFTVRFRADGSMFVNALTSTDLAINPPVLLVSPEGTVLGAYGEHLDGQNPKILKQFRYVDEDDDGNLWIASAYQYKVEKWRSDGAEGFEMDTVFYPGTVEFPSIEEHQLFPMTRDSPAGPSPLLYGVWREPGGPVWTLVHEAHPDWRERYPDDGTVEPASFLPSTSLWRTRVDALDPESGEVLASSVFEENLMGFIGGGKVFSYAMSENSAPFLRIWRLSLEP